MANSQTLTKCSLNIGFYHGITRLFSVKVVSNKFCFAVCSWGTWFKLPCFIVQTGWFNHQLVFRFSHSLCDLWLQRDLIATLVYHTVSHTQGQSNDNVLSVALPKTISWYLVEKQQVQNLTAILLFNMCLFINKSSSLDYICWRITILKHTVDGWSPANHLWIMG